MAILWLTLSVNEVDTLSTYSRFLDLAGSEGFTFRTLDVGSRDNLRPFDPESLLEADAYVISSPDLLLSANSIDQLWNLDANDYVQILRQRIRDGVRMLALVSLSNWHQTFNPLLDDFGLTVTNHQPFNEQNERSNSIDTRIRAIPQPQNDAIKVDRLLESVNEVGVLMPWLLHHSAASQELLVCPSRGSKFGLINVETGPGSDDFLQIPPGLAPICGAVWSRTIGGQPSLTALTGYCLTNGLLDLNKNFARNLLEWLGESEWESPLREEASKHLGVIETALFSVVAGVLESRSHDHWLETLPAGDVERAKKQQSDNVESDAPTERFLNLVHLKKALKLHWAAFAPLFEGEATQRARREKTVWFNEVLRIRNRVDHPLREEVDPVTPEEIAFLEDVRRQVVRVARRFKASKSSPAPRGGGPEMSRPLQ